MRIRYIQHDLNHKPHCYQQKKREKQGGRFARELKKRCGGNAK